MNELIEDWGLWCRVGLGRPRVVAVEYNGGARGVDFNELQMARLDDLIAALGKPTSELIKGVYQREWSVKDAANQAGFKVEATAARELLNGAIKRLERAWSASV